MARRADLDAFEADAQRLQTSDLEAQERRAALDGLTGPNLSAQDAAENARAARRLGLDRDEVPFRPLAREEARRGELQSHLAASQHIQAWLAERRSNAALANPDLLTLVEAETDWRAVAQESLSGWWERANEQERLRQERLAAQGARWRADLGRSLGTDEGRAQIVRDARLMGQNLSSEEWWRRQGDAGSRSAGAAWESTIQFIEGLPDAWKDANLQFAVGQRAQEQADIGWRIMMGQELPADRARLAELRGVEEPMPTTWVGPAAQSLPMTWRGILASARGGLQTGIYGGAIGGGLALAGGQMGPQAATPEEIATAPLAAAAAFSLTFGAGALIGGAQEMGRTEAGLAFTEYTDPSFVDEVGRPLDPTIARNAAFLVGAINGGLEVASLGVLVRQLPGGSELLAGGAKAQARARIRNLLRRSDFRNALGRLGRSTLIVGATEAATEFSQESVTVQGMRLAAGMDSGATGDFPLPSNEEAFQRALHGGWFGFQAGTTLGFAGGSVRTATVDVPRIFQANRDRQHLENLAAHIERTQLRSAAPEIAGEAIDRATRGGPAEVYVDPQQIVQLFQSQDVAMEWAENLPGVGREALAQASDAESAIPIPISTFASHVVGTPAWAGLRSHMRLTPEGLSPFEAEQLKANEPAIMREVNDIVRRQQVSGEAAETFQMIEASIQRQLDEAGVTIPDANRVQARVTAAMVMNAARFGGENPIKLYESYFGNITGPFEDQASTRSPQAGDIAQEGPGDIAAEALRIKQASGLQDLRLTLDEARGEIVLDLIVTPKGQRSQGVGARALQELTSYADRFGLRIVVTPTKRGGGLGTRSRGAVAEFFKRHGFIENKGDTRDSAVSQEMYRPSDGTFQMRQEQAPSRARFDPRAVDAEYASAGRPAIPVPGTPDFEALLDRAVEKQAMDQPLSPLEAWAIERAALGLDRGPEGEALYQEEGQPQRAGPLPSRQAHIGRVRLPPITGNERQLRTESAPPQQAPFEVSTEDARRMRVAALLLERNELNQQIESRLRNELALPSVEQAMERASALRVVAYCTARQLAKAAAATTAAIGAAGTAAAVATVAGVMGPGEVDPGGPPAPSEAAGRVPSARVAIPPADAPSAPAAPVRLPDTNTAEALVSLPADEALEAIVPETISQASARAALTDPDLPVVTNNRASEPQAPNEDNQ